MQNPNCIRRYKAPGNNVLPPAHEMSTPCIVRMFTLAATCSKYHKLKLHHVITLKNSRPL